MDSLLPCFILTWFAPDKKRGVIYSPRFIEILLSFARTTQRRGEQRDIHLRNLASSVPPWLLFQGIPYSIICLLPHFLVRIEQGDDAQQAHVGVQQRGHDRRAPQESFGDDGAMGG